MPDSDATDRPRRVLVLGATGFVGRALLPALLAEGYQVRATTRHLDAGLEGLGAPPSLGRALLANLEWVRCDVRSPADLQKAMEGVSAVYFLVHAMGEGGRAYARTEHRVAKLVREFAAEAGVERVIYLGGVAPSGAASEHLRSRLMVGEVLRAGSVPTLELRASMIVGNGGASWQIVRDLAMRLPAMVLPAWTASETRPVDLDDVVVALVRALDVPLEESAWYDIPGPDVVDGRTILATLAALRGRRVPSVPVPLLGVSLSSWWLKLITRTDFSLARELVLGFTGDLLPRDDHYWSLIGYQPQWSFEAAAKKALGAEETELSLRGMAGRLEETVVQLVSPKLPG